jgi:hypothetical protein
MSDIGFKRQPIAAGRSRPSHPSRQSSCYQPLGRLEPATRETQLVSGH